MRYRRRIARQLMVFALPALAGLALLGRLNTLTIVPPEFAPLAFGDADATVFYLVAAIGGMTLGAALLAFRDRLGGRAYHIGATDALLPRGRAELGPAVLLSICAGVSEELFFRLLVPLVIASATGSPLFGFAIATAMFAAAHRYQGGIGILAGMVLGSLFAGLYLATATLWAAMIVHIALDLATLVLRPALTGVWRVR